jgi:hypothetical protein
MSIKYSAMRAAEALSLVLLCWSAARPYFDAIIKIANGNYFRLVYIYNKLRDMDLNDAFYHDIQLLGIRERAGYLTGQGTGGAFTLLDDPDTLHNAMIYERYK